jgi:glycosyltransferase involved in cell wall biosynthesis
MKILFYFGGFAPVGGIETFCYNLLSHLQIENFQCSLLCWGRQSELLTLLQHSGTKIMCNPWRWGCRWDLPDWMLLPKGCQLVKQADVVILGKLFPHSILKKIKLSAGSNTRFVYVTPYKPYLPPTERERLRILEKLQLFDLILVQSTSFVDDLRRLGYKGKIEVVPYISLQTSSPCPFPPYGQLKIGFLGRLVEDKNIPFLLEAFNCFQNKYFKNVKNSEPILKLFGDGHLRQELEQLVRALGLESRVIFHGNISNDTVYRAVSNCHLFAFTSTNEGQCLAALEILGGGRPIVATPAGALPEILADKNLGRIVWNPTPESFAENLLDVVTNIYQGTISTNSVQEAYLKRYDTKQIAKQYVDILTKLSK